LKKTFTTGEGGHFTFTFIEPGFYTLEAQASGFKINRRPRLRLEVGQAVDLNVTLYFTTNLSLQRDFRFTENARLQIRAEAFNVFNRANFQAPGTAFGAANFGVITGAEDPRQVQFAARIYF